MNQARAFMGRSMNSNRGLMVSGGSFNGKRLSSVELYGEQGWATISELPFATDNHAQVATTEATYVFGGSERKTTVLKLNGDDFEEIGQLKSMRVGATAHVINKDIYIVDGNPLTEELTIELWHHEGKFSCYFFYLYFYDQVK